MSRQLSNAIDLAYGERIDRLVLALTGRTGSGCSTAASILAKEIHEISISPEDFEGAESRKIRIAHEFARKHWLPFKIVTISTLIYGYLLEEEWTAIEEFLLKQKLKTSTITSIRGSLEGIKEHEHISSFLNTVHGTAQPNDQPLAWSFYSNQLSSSAREVKSLLDSSYAPVFQALGDHIRLSGNALSAQISPDKIFDLMRRVKRIINAAVSFDRNNGFSSTRVVIDAIRNPLELVYLRDQFASFYAIALTTDDDDRTSRLSDLGLKNSDIERLDKKEYARPKKHLSDYQAFVSQNIQECIQKADVFFRNPGKTRQLAQTIRALNAQVIRYVALVMRPGLITPTQDERCMQLAFVAKLNSGCISRQVGAAVSDRNFSIKAVGWNDVPKGQVPCLLRDVHTLLTSSDASAFSEYEKTDTKLRQHLSSKFQHRELVRREQGLGCPFCFKDAYNEVMDKDNQVHTRSLHAEENAFLQLAKYGNSGIDGGVLYTTASPCELCSKKAYQLGIKEIVYVDPYPGISATHVLKSGEAQPRLRLFSGAVGHAYHRLYDAILPIKDEYKVRLAEDVQPDLL